MYDATNIEIKGARINNLKNIDVTIPRDKLIVITGLSGSGKSSLAFDTLYAEGQRRYIETFTAYARNMLGGMERPDVDKITGLSPVISIEQKIPNSKFLIDSSNVSSYLFLSQVDVIFWYFLLLVFKRFIVF